VILVRAPKDLRYAELVQKNREHEATTMLLHADQHLVNLANRLRSPKERVCLIQAATILVESLPSKTAGS
jgi:hypothetical protein